ncbi:GDSL lipase/esterase [Dillenia turbinata]|uniref:GDSL lipase/esterase n=1 Tax=Dillenia turbinata TaxID=194707 RepID=A0AAN8W198_9MAGN
MKRHYSPGFTSMAVSLTSLLCLSTVFLSSNLVFASKDCKFPALFNFGDSNSDTGGLAATFESPVPPYGETYFHMPAGRFSDGRLIVDFIAHSFGFPYLSAYLNSLRSNFSHGANFAVAASTITPPSSILPQGGYSPFELDVQLWQFMHFKNQSQIVKKLGGIFADLMPEEEYFAKALYMFDIGQNDLGDRIFRNLSIEEVNASVPDIVDSFTTNVKVISLSLSVSLSLSLIIGIFD